MIKISDLLFLSLVIVVVVSGMVGFAGIMFSNYGVVSTDLQSVNKTVELGSKIEETYEKFKSENVQDQWIGGSLVTGADVLWNTILSYLTIPDLFSTWISDLGSAGKLPPLITGAIITAIVTIVILAFLYVLSGKEW